jgi:hypothetical protein
MEEDEFGGHGGFSPAQAHLLYQTIQDFFANPSTLVKGFNHDSKYLKFKRQN